MKTVKSKTQKTVSYDMGKFRHIVSYTADDTDAAAVRIETLTDDIITLVADDVASGPKGKLEYDGENIIAAEITICPCFAGIVADLKAIIEGIRTGVPAQDVPYPVEDIEGVQEEVHE